jgi:hypothetical protein
MVANVDPLSVSLTRNPILWKARLAVGRSLSGLRRLGHERFYGHTQHHWGDCPELVVERPLNNIRMALFRARMALRRLRRPRCLTSNHWQLAIRPASGASEWGGSGWARRFRKVAAPGGKFRADPFLFEDGDATWVFFEEFDRAAGKGVICCASIGSDGRPAPAQVVLDRPYHLSNPFVFDSDGDIYLLPETSTNQRLELYRCVEYPHRWELAFTAFDGLRVIDPVLIRVRDLWWMFMTIGDQRAGTSNDELHLFFADRLEGPWQPHALNPVVCDVTQARPAGRVFVEDGVLWRYAQDCSGGYGRAIHRIRIDELTTSTYGQTVVARADPAHLNASGVHAYDRSRRVEVMDVRHHRMKIGPFSLRWPLALT